MIPLCFLAGGLQRSSPLPSDAAECRSWGRDPRASKRAFRERGASLMPVRLSVGGFSAFSDKFNSVALHLHFGYQRALLASN